VERWRRDRPVHLEVALNESDDGTGEVTYPDPHADWKHVDRTADRIAERRATDVFERLAAIFEDDEEGKPPALRFCPEAQAIFDHWLGQLEHQLRRGDEHQALISQFGKYRSLMPAIALVYHLASGPGCENTPITALAAQTAIRWCEYLEHHARRVYSIAAIQRVPSRN
jgi:putative DNA primase/helicase